MRELQGLHPAGLGMGKALPASAALPLELTVPLWSAAVLGQWPASSGYVLSQAGWHAETSACREGQRLELRDEAEQDDLSVGC